MSEVTNKARMPKGPHWAIVTYGSVYHEGDQRSIDNPGHGYPAYSEEIVNYQAFENEDDWKEQIRDYTIRKETFSAMHVNPAKITTEVNVEIQ